MNTTKISPLTTKFLGVKGTVYRLFKNVMKPTPAALAWAAQQRFSALASADTIIAAYEAHLRLLAKIAARKASK